MDKNWYSTSNNQSDNGWKEFTKSNNKTNENSKQCKNKQKPTSKNNKIDMNIYTNRFDILQ